MRALIQRASYGSVSIEGKRIAEIGRGYVVFLGVKEGDSEEEAKQLAEKTAHLRIMADEQRKMNRSIVDVGGDILVVPQFTLYADTTAGRRPSFFEVARPDDSKPLYQLFVEELKRLGAEKVVTGEFGAYMSVEIHNDGPVTIILET